MSFRVNVSLSAAQSWAPRHADPSSHFTPLSQFRQYLVLPYVTLRVFPGFPGALTPSKVAIAREASSLRRYVMYIPSSSESDEESSEAEVGSEVDGPLRRNTLAILPYWPK